MHSFNESNPVAASRPLDCQRHLFDIPEDVSYFNCASLAPLMRTAQVAGQNALRLRAEPWRIRIDDWFDGVEERRSLFASLIGANAEAIAMVPSTSYGLAAAACNMTAAPTQRVVVIANDYPSNVYTWRAFCRRHGCELHTVHRAAGSSWTAAVLAAIDDRAAIVAVPNVHWTDGALLDLVAIGQAARAVGARLAIDASQSAGAMPLDIAAIQPDFLVAVGYKWLLGPFGLGYLYVAPEHCCGVPLEENWIAREGSEDFAHLTDYTETYQSGARRFDVGERTFFEVTPVASAALRQLAEWTVERVAITLRTLTTRIERGARELGIDIEDASQRGPHILGLKLPDKARGAAADHFRRAGVWVGVRPGAVRVSPHVYTSDEDVDRLLTALSELIG